MWAHPDFLRLWSGQTISLCGTEITQLALPLTAMVFLQATPVQMGLLNAVQFAPFLLVGLLAETWVDRWRSRPILLWTTVGQAVVLGSIPAAALFAQVGLRHVYTVGFMTGVFTVFFDVAYQAVLSTLIGREHLVEGNSKLRQALIPPRFQGRMHTTMRCIGWSTLPLGAIIGGLFGRNAWGTPCAGGSRDVRARGGGIEMC